MQNGIQPCSHARNNPLVVPSTIKLCDEKVMLQ